MDKFHDIIPKEKRSIRNIPIPKRHGSIEDSLVDPAAEEAVPAKGHHKPHKERAPERQEEPAAPEAESAELAADHHLKVSMDGIKSAPKRGRKPKKAAEEPIEEERQGAEAEPAFLASEEKEESYEEWRSHRRGLGWKAWVVIALLAAGGFYGAAIFFSSATIRISPTEHQVAFASFDLPMQSVPHSIAEVSAEDIVNVKASGTAKVDRKATGRVVLYNTYTSSPQKLIVDTRLETPEGLVYKLTKGVDIPGFKIVAGKKTPGSIEAEIVADAAGEKYNIGLKDFKVAAYKGSDRYDSVYGRSKTALSGGFSGTMPNISAADLKAAEESLRTGVLSKADALLKQEAAKKPGFSYVPEARTVVYIGPTQTISKDGLTASISLKATVTGVLFDAAALSNLLVAEKTQKMGAATSTEAEESAYSGDLSGLRLVPKGSAGAAELRSGSAIFTASGTSTFSSAIDAVRIAKAVSGLSKEQALSALRKIVDLESVEISVQPWWKSALPTASSKIKVILEE